MTGVFRICVRLAFVSLVLCLATAHALAWDHNGHRLSVLIALEFRPDLKPRLEKLIVHLPNSRQWRELKAGGFSQNSRMEEKGDPDKWIADLMTDLPKIATFADWIRDYAVASKHSAHHYINLSYETNGRNEFLREPNAVTMTDSYVKYFPKEAPEQAWAVAWLTHLIGDLHQPLHCIARKLPDGQSDRGGNGVKHGNSNLHAYWDNLFDDKARSLGLPAYAKQLYAEGYSKLDAEDKAAFDKKRANQNPMSWAMEGQEAIRAVGYPADNLVSDYDKAALRVAETRILLASARMADVLDKLIPK
ncbi:MAG: S1/P1 nuclease [Fimbriimonadaceae bacterium]|nr:S1/P1 nuclease [Fimbriimonadaceae bacterium]